MSSGVQCTQEVIDSYNQIKLGKDCRYVLYGLLNKDKEIGVIKKAPRTSTYDDLIADLKEAQGMDQGRYVVYDFEYEAGISKLIFLFWCPNDMKVRNRMLYASSKDAIKKKLPGMNLELEVHDFDEISPEILHKKVTVKI